jgi:hypothetical protein
MPRTLEDFRVWIEEQSSRLSYFSGTFWILFSNLDQTNFERTLHLAESSVSLVPGGARSVTVSVTKRGGTAVSASFFELPFEGGHVHVLFSLEKPNRALRPMYRLLARSRGKVQLFPIGHPLFKACVRLFDSFTFDATRVLRGVSYPSRPNEGGADINLKPGSASAFFTRLEEEKRVLKTAKLRAPVSPNAYTEYTIGRPGYITYHKGPVGPLLELIRTKLTNELSKSVRPFERAAGHFVEFNFPEPLFVDRANYVVVLDALAKLPRTSVALLHANPYFHAAVTNYEDGAEFDVFITDHSTIHVQGHDEVSPASFLRIQNGLTEQFQDARVSLEKTSDYSLRDLMEGQV